MKKLTNCHARKKSVDGFQVETLKDIISLLDKEDSASETVACRLLGTYITSFVTNQQMERLIAEEVHRLSKRFDVNALNSILKDYSRCLIGDTYYDVGFGLYLDSLSKI